MFVPKVVVAPVGSPSGPGQVRLTVTPVALHGMPPLATLVFLSVTV